MLNQISARKKGLLSIDSLYVYRYPLAALFSAIAYLNTMQFGFVWDDQVFILNSPFIQDWKNLFHIFTPDFLRHSWKDLDVNRPVMVVSLILDFWVWRLDPMGYHLTNLLLHTLNTLSLLYMLDLIFLDRRITLISAVIFAVHPVHIEAVSAINFREDLLVTLFFLLSLICFIKGLRPEASKWISFLSIVFYLFALLSKETALTLPIIAFLYLRVWMWNSRRYWIFIGYILATGVYLLFFLYTQQFSSMVVAERPLASRLFGALVIAGHYIWLHLFPIGLNPDYEQNIFFMGTLKNAATAAAVLVFMGWTSYRLIIRPHLKYFFLSWFFITLIPVMNIAPMVNPAAERYLYLPSVGLIVGVVIAGVSLLDKEGKFALKAVGTLTLLLLVLTIKENAIWRDDISLWSYTIKKSPRSVRAYHGLGNAYRDKEEWDMALYYWKETVRLKPNQFSEVYSNIGNVYRMKDQDALAVKEYENAIKINPDNVEAHYSLAATLEELGQIKVALEHYNLFIKKATESYKQEVEETKRHIKVLEGQ